MTDNFHLKYWNMVTRTGLFPVCMFVVETNGIFSVFSLLGKHLLGNSVISRYLLAK